MNAKTLQAARDDTVRYLGYSERTESQLRKHLAKRGYDSEVTDSVCTWAIDNEFINDLRFAEVFIKSHTDKSPLASVRIRQELKKRGVSEDIIATALNDRDDENMFDGLVRILTKKYGRLPRKTAYRRAAGYLNRHGFSSELTYRILEKCFNSGDE